MSHKRKLKKVGDKKWERCGKFNRHHIKNKCRGGTWAPQNILIMDIQRHNAWHFLFRNMSFEEVIELLKRTLELQKFKE
jgi:hypothetical protein